MEAILGGMIEGVLVVNEHGRLQLVNAAARRMLRLQDGAEGRHYLEIVRQPDIAAQLGAALARHATEGLELTLPREPELIVIARSAPVAAERDDAARCSSCTTSPTCARADRIRRDFVANVSHELRTPLTAVRGYVEALLDGGAERTVRRGGSSRSSAATRCAWSGWCATCCGWRGSTPARSRSSTCRASSSRSSPASRAELMPRSRSRDRPSSTTSRRTPTTVTGDPAKLHDALRNLLENAIELRARRRARS